MNYNPGATGRKSGREKVTHTFVCRKMLQHSNILLKQAFILFAFIYDITTTACMDPEISIVLTLLFS